MKKFLALALLVSFAGVHAADADETPKIPTPPAQSDNGVLGRYSQHPWAAAGGATVAGVMYLIMGGRDAQSGVTALGVGAGAGIASKIAIDKIAPSLPDDRYSNMVKGAAGPLVVKYAPTLLDTASQGTQAIRTGK